MRFLTKLPVMSGIYLIPEPDEKHFCNSPYPKLLLVGQRRWSIGYHLLLFQIFLFKVIGHNGVSDVITFSHCKLDHYLF